MNRIASVHRRRSGTTFLELTMAAMLLGATLLSLSTFRQRALGSSQSAQRASFAQSRLLNFRCEISTWPYDTVEVEAIENVSADDSAFLPQASWRADVKAIEEPIVGKQVVLALQWQEGSTQRVGPSLTFWVKRP